MFICFMCECRVQEAKRFEDMVGNKIYICKKCLDGNYHRIEYRYRPLQENWNKKDLVCDE